MQIGRLLTSQPQPSELLGSIHGKPSLGFSELLLNALLGRLGLGEEGSGETPPEPGIPINACPSVESTSKSQELSQAFPAELSVFSDQETGLVSGVSSTNLEDEEVSSGQLLHTMDEGFLAYSSKAFPNETQSDKKDPPETQRTDLSLGELPGSVVFFAGQVLPQGSFSSEITQTGSGAPGAPKVSWEGQELRLLTLKREEGLGTNSSGFEEIPQTTGLKPSQETAPKGDFFPDQEKVSGPAWKETLGDLKNPNQDSPTFQHSLGDPSEAFSLKEEVAFHLRKKALIEPGLSPKDPHGATLVQEAVQRGAGWEISFKGVAGKSLGKNVLESDQGLGLHKASQPKEEDLAKPVFESGRGSFGSSSGSQSHEQTEAGLGQNQEAFDTVSSLRHLGFKEQGEASGPKESQHSSESSQFLQPSKTGASLQVEAGEASFQQLNSAVQVSGNSQELFSVATKRRSSGEAGAAGFGGDLKPQVQGALFKDRQVVHMQMDPPELGLLRVRLKVHKEGVEALFLAQGTEQKAALEQGFSQLRQSLAEQGFVSQRLAVDIGGGGAQWMSQGNANSEFPAGHPGTAVADSSQDEQIFCTIKKEQGLIHLRI